MYVDDLGWSTTAYALGLAFVNYRWRAHTKACALTMHAASGRRRPRRAGERPHYSNITEIRSCVKQDGSKYKSCPLRDV